MCRVTATVGPITNQAVCKQVWGTGGVYRAEKPRVSKGVLPAEKKIAERLLRDRQRTKATQPKRDGRLETEGNCLPLWWPP